MTRRITTAHAVIRHLARVQGVDIRAIKEAMLKAGIEDLSDGSVLAYMRKNTIIDIKRSTASLADETLQMAVNCGARAVIRDGFRYHIQASVVATVIPLDRVHTFNKIRHGERRPGAWKARVIREMME